MTYSDIFVLCFRTRHLPHPQLTSFLYCWAELIKLGCGQERMEDQKKVIHLKSRVVEKNTHTCTPGAGRGIKRWRFFILWFNSQMGGLKPGVWNPVQVSHVDTEAQALQPSSTALLPGTWQEHRLQTKYPVNQHPDMGWWSQKQQLTVVLAPGHQLLGSPFRWCYKRSPYLKVQILGWWALGQRVLLKRS